MFSKWGERSGLFGFLAPRKKSNKDVVVDGVNDGSTEPAAGHAAMAQETSREEDGPEPFPQAPQREKTSSKEGAAQDHELLRRRQQEENHRRLLLQSQRKREREAAERGAFVKKQRVQYFHKQNQTWADAIVLGVHLDDGPDKPYYTIKYERLDIEVDDDTGEKHTIRTLIEKQTTPDRLRRVEWDEGATWGLLK